MAKNTNVGLAGKGQTQIDSRLKQWRLNNAEAISLNSGSEMGFSPASWSQLTMTLRSLLRNEVAVTTGYLLSVKADGSHAKTAFLARLKALRILRVKL